MEALVELASRLRRTYGYLSWDQVRRHIHINLRSANSKHDIRQYQRSAYHRKCWYKGDQRTQHETARMFLKEYKDDPFASAVMLYEYVGFILASKRPEIKARLDERYAKGWEMPVWRHEDWLDTTLNLKHFPHVSEDNPAMIAYTPSLEKLVAGVQVRCKPGRYLMQFYGPGSANPVLTEAQVKEWSDRFVAHSAPAELHLIENDDPDGWVWVYENSDPSCMRYNRSGRYLHDSLHGDMHPVRAYAHPENDLALAFVMKPGEKLDRSVVSDYDEFIVGARCLINKANMQYHRVYCDDDRNARRLKQQLEARGYTQGDEVLRGQKLVRMDFGSGFVCPYLDGCYIEVDAYATHLVVNRGCRYDGQNSCGHIGSAEEYSCPCCGSDVEDEDDLTYVECRGEAICDECLNERYVYAYVSRRSQEYARREDAYEFNGEYYTSDALSDHDLYICDDCGELTDEIDCTEDDEYLCPNCSAQDDVTEKYYRRLDTTGCTLDGRIHDDELVVTFPFDKSAHIERCYKIVWQGRKTYVHRDFMESMDALKWFRREGDSLVPCEMLTSNDLMIQEAFSIDNLTCGEYTDYDEDSIPTDCWGLEHVELEIAA